MNTKFYRTLTIFGRLTRYDSSHRSASLNVSPLKMPRKKNPTLSGPRQPEQKGSKRRKVCLIHLTIPNMYLWFGELVCTPTMMSATDVCAWPVHDLRAQLRIAQSGSSWLKLNLAPSTFFQLLLRNTTLQHATTTSLLRDTIKRRIRAQGISLKLWRT